MFTLECALSVVGLWRGGTDAQRLQIASKNICYRRSVASVYFSLICKNEEIFWKLIIIICDVSRI
jgi:hypothetical protein